MFSQNNLFKFSFWDSCYALQQRTRYEQSDDHSGLFRHNIIRMSYLLNANLFMKNDVSKAEMFTFNNRKVCLRLSRTKVSKRLCYSMVIVCILYKFCTSTSHELSLIYLPRYALVCTRKAFEPDRPSLMMVMMNEYTKLIHLQCR